MATLTAPLVEGQGVLSHVIVIPGVGGVINPASLHHEEEALGISGEYLDGLGGNGRQGMARAGSS